VTPRAASTAPTRIPASPAAAFARRVRTLRIALIVALAIAAPLVVALVTMSSRAGVEDAYRAQARADAAAVALDAGSASRARLAAIQRSNAGVAGIAVYRETPNGYRRVATTGAAPALGAGAGTAERSAGGRRLLEVKVPVRGGRIVAVAWDLRGTDAAVAARTRGFPLALALGVGGAALLLYLLISRLGLRRLARLADEMAVDQQSLEAMALEDPLTGLPNKRAFNDRLAAELGRAAREYYPVSVVAMDLDKFKSINDSWGHAVGDEALQKLARELQRQLRAGDLCGRMGGDEFMLALVRADVATAEKVLGRLKGALKPVEVGPGRQKIRFSAGIAEFPRHTTDMATLVNQADAALYWGKAHGRDRWHVYSPEAGHALGDGNSPTDGVKRRNMLNTLQQLAKAVDAKNRYTADHSDLVCAYAVAIAKALGLKDDQIERIRTAAMLHDVGKIGVPTHVLVKDGPLNLDDMDQLARHSELGHAMVAGGGMPEEARVVFHVHERWDGGGYPDKLAGTAIPLEARIICAADALDRAVRPTAHRRERPLREALAELEFCAGTKLDPDVCARMVALVREGQIKVPGHEPQRQRRAGDRRAVAAG
jgi:diguanylate cyclase (GGDEF)-like protein